MTRKRGNPNKKRREKDDEDELTQEHQHRLVLDTRSDSAKNQLRVADTVPLVHSVHLDSVETVLVELP